MLGVAAYARGDYAAAAARMEQGLPARGSDDLAILGSLLGDLGHVSLVLGDHRRARELLGEALAVQARHGDLQDRRCLAEGVLATAQPELGSAPVWSGGRTERTGRRCALPSRRSMPRSSTKPGWPWEK